jgi:Uncharacterised nucleotidyltransferase
MEALLARAGDGFEWERAVGHAAYHGVMPVLGPNLATLTAVPLPIRERVREWSRQNAASNLLKFAELVRVDRLFASQGIETIHFKGAVLAAHAFGNLALREFSDLDVLVHERDAREARALLLANGYRSTLSAAGEELHLRTSYWLGFAHESAPLKIDLHWKLADPFFRYEPDLSTLWANARTLQLGGAEVATFGPEDTVLVLAAHGFKHAYSRLKWVCDLAEWIRVHPDLDWDAIVAMARTLHVARILRLSLRLVHEFDASVVPPELASRCGSDARAVALADRAWAQIFLDAPVLEGVSAQWFHARGRERRIDGVAYLWFQCVRRFKRAVVPNELDRGMVRLPAGLGFLYYLLRPIRLGKKLLFGSRVSSAD